MPRPACSWACWASFGVGGIRDRISPRLWHGVTAIWPAEATQVTDVNSLVQRVADVSLDQLDDAIVDLRQLRDFLHSEGERIQGEISGYLQLNHTSIGATRSIIDNIAQWKKAAHSTARGSEQGDFVASTVPPAPSSTAAKDILTLPK